MRKPEQMYNLEYWVGSRKVETSMVNKPKPICLWKKRELIRAGTHTAGSFKLVKI